MGEEEAPKNMKPEKGCFWIGRPPCDSPKDKRRPEMTMNQKRNGTRPNDPSSATCADRKGGA